jgi:hypothetical protein
LITNEKPAVEAAVARGAGDPTDWRGRLASWPFVALILALVAIALHDVI